MRLSKPDAGIPLDIARLPGGPAHSFRPPRPDNPEIHSPSMAARNSDAAVEAAGEVDPAGANDLVTAGRAVLVDVRTAEELKRVGSVPGSLHVAWQLGPAMTKNPRFLKELSLKVKPDATVLFICRSGRRSADAALAAARAGYASAFNVVEGVEGIDDSGTSGWRDRGLPWSPGQAR